MSRRMHGGEVLARSSCAGLARVIRLRVSIAMFRLRNVADEEKKKKHSVEYFFLDEFDWFDCIEAVQECFCVCDNYAVFCEIFDEFI